MKKDIILNRIKYFFSSLLKNFFRSNKRCTYCNSLQYKVISKKFFVTKLVRCENCKFMFRIPTTTVKENDAYYQDKYTGGGQDLIDDKDNFTVDIPNEIQKKNEKFSDFKEAYNNTREHILSCKVVKHLEKIQNV